MDFPLNNRYQIERDGRIFDSKDNRYMQPFENKNSKRMQVKLIINDKRKCFYVARLVALTYLPNPTNLPYVDHIDRDVKNNNFSNLRWVNKRQSTNHSIHRNKSHVKHVYKRPNGSFQVMIRDSDGILKSYGHFKTIEVAADRAVAKAQELQGVEYAYVSE